jgi:hypothetical protein
LHHDVVAFEVMPFLRIRTMVQLRLVSNEALVRVVARGVPNRCVILSTPSSAAAAAAVVPLRSTTLCEYRLVTRICGDQSDPVSVVFRMLPAAIAVIVPTIPAAGGLGDEEVSCESSISADDDDDDDGARVAVRRLLSMCHVIPRHRNRAGRVACCSQLAMLPWHELDDMAAALGGGGGGEDPLLPAFLLQDLCDAASPVEWWRDWAISGCNLTSRWTGAAEARLIIMGESMDHMQRLPGGGCRSIVASRVNGVRRLMGAFLRSTSVDDAGVREVTVINMPHLESIAQYWFSDSPTVVFMNLQDLPALTVIENRFCQRARSLSRVWL